MKRSVLLFSLLLSAGISFSQSAEIYVDQLSNCVYTGQVNSIDFPTHDFSGEVIEVSYTGPSNANLELTFTNISNSTINWLVSRRRISVDPTWTDFIIWAHEDNQFGGLGVDVAFMDTNIWTAPDIISFTVTAEPGESALAVPHIIPDLTATGCGTYRYYVGTALDPFQDSVDVQVCHSLGLEEGTGFELSIAPNPTNDHFEISTESGEIMNYSVVNAIGQTVNSGVFTKNHTVEASQFEGGLYFVTVTDESGRTKTNRIVVNH
jgi:hypothetical protein